jgi:mevalonate kinase
MLENKIYRAVAPAKVILAGEHSVVYGRYALASAIDLFTEVTIKPIPQNRFLVISDRFGTICVNRDYPEDVPGELKPIITILSELFTEAGNNGGCEISISAQAPPASGLGSSASVFVAVVAASLLMFKGYVDLDEVVQKSMLGERIAHANPSGVDVWISANGGSFLYRRGETPKRLSISYDLPVIIGLTGISRKTAAMVELFGKNLSRHIDGGKRILDLMNDIALREAVMLEKGDLQGAGELMILNHFILTEMGVSHDVLNRLVWASIEAGSYGAKLTGAGGGGAMLSLCGATDIDLVEMAIKRAGGNPLKAKSSKEGVKAWEEASQ